MTAGGGEHACGLGDEAAKLLDALRGWAQDLTTAAGGECVWCPLCRLVALVRAEQPEATAKVMAAGSAFLEALRGGLTPPATERAHEPAPRVQRIDLGSG